MKNTSLPPDLPDPSADAAAASAALLATIRRDIAHAGGWISFARYMELVLYTPGLGYYSGGSVKLGRDGDFVTAPEISPLFGRALAQQVAQIMALSVPEVLEFGAGSGRLAIDVLRQLDALDALPRRYAILELSGELRARQREALQEAVPQWLDRVIWLDALPQRWSGAIIANEVLDAMPVRLAVRRGSAWLERGVSLDGTTLTDAERPADAGLIASILHQVPDVETLPDGYVIEINDAAAAFARTLSAHLECGAALLIDYGFPRHEYYHPQRVDGTLMAHYRHRAHGDVLRWPGLQDITAHVDFSMVAEQSVLAGAELLGYASQANFLLNCGIASLLDANAGNALAWLPQTNALQRLLSEAEMGELFKVLAIGKGLEEPLIGFTRGDRSASL